MKAGTSCLSLLYFSFILCSSWWSSRMARRTMDIWSVVTTGWTSICEKLFAPHEWVPCPFVVFLTQRTADHCKLIGQGWSIRRVIWKTEHFHSNEALPRLHCATFLAQGCSTSVVWHGREAGVGWVVRRGGQHLLSPQPGGVMFSKLCSQTKW